MTPRPFHRWKSFWLGLLVTCFLAWAWQDSLRFESWFSVQHIGSANAGGAIALSRETAFHRPPGFSTGPVQWGRYDLKSIPELTTPVLVAPLFSRGREQSNLTSFDEEDHSISIPYRELLKVRMFIRPPEDWLLFIPHWLLLLAFVTPWSAFLIWRARRMSRHVPDIG